MTDTERLVAFLLQRCEELSDNADRIHLIGCGMYVGSPGPFPCDCGEPARVLADCAVRRTIIAHCSTMIACPDSDGTTSYIPGPVQDHPVLFALAQPFRDHPGFDPSWAAD